nr:hypothetical protein [Allomuricauda sp.]
MDFTPKYPENKALMSLYERHSIKVSQIVGKYLLDCLDYPLIHLVVGLQEFEFYVDDEFHDLQVNNPLLSLCLALRELEGYRDEGPLEQWCKALMLDSENTQVTSHYRNLERIYPSLVSLLGPIDSQISDLDFQLNAGAAQELRNS